MSENIGLDSRCLRASSQLGLPYYGITNVSHAPTGCFWSGMSGRNGYFNTYTGALDVITSEVNVGGICKKKGMTDDWYILTLPFYEPNLSI